MISLMYKVPMRQITGGPDWLTNDRYNVEAKTDGSYNIDELHTMTKICLLIASTQIPHRDEGGPVYALMVDTPGSKMKVNDGPQDYKIPMTFSPEGLVGARVPMSYLACFLVSSFKKRTGP